MRLTTTADTQPSTSVRARIRAYCARRPEIVAAYLFGSAARGQAGPLSDLDVAFLLDRRRAHLCGSLAYQAARLSDLMAVLRTTKVDLTLLPCESPILAHRVLRDGTLLFSRDARQRRVFEEHVIRTFLDLKPFYDLQTRRFFAKLMASGAPRRARHG
ncbi:type VII toxin-antitoxin system MntA family adenylyltransferase antitoxin [Nitrospira sp. Kam-Ns4a]